MKKFLHGLVFLLCCMLVIAPPGGSVCWPLPGGHHLHIGWNDAEGEETLDLTVFTHRASQSVGDPHAPSFSPASSSELPTVGGVLLPQVVTWLLPLITLVWRLRALAVFPHVWCFPPATPPPRRASAF
jgi:hypothetical protein